MTPMRLAAAWDGVCIKTESRGSVEGLCLSKWVEGRSADRELGGTI